MLIANRHVGENHGTYFIADIAANHNGSLQRALHLMSLAKQSGADAAKFQHFRAEHIVSDKGYKELGTQKSHQSTWNKSVFDVYKEAELPWEWTQILADHADQIGIDFFTSPYDIEAIDFVNQYVSAFKIGSGDITWLNAIAHMASKGKPIILATGASVLSEVSKAVEVIRSFNVPFSVMQCNTNYTGSDSNFKHINLNVLHTYRKQFPEAVLGLSDHTHGDLTVLGAVALGARIIEKHFTDDISQEGPDHHFSMTPETWASMVHKVRMLEDAMGSFSKEVASNESDTVVIQRRGLRFSRDIPAGELIQEEDLSALRPATPGCLTPDGLDKVVGKRLSSDVSFHDVVTSDLFI